MYNPGLIGIGDILWDHLGNLIFAYAVSLGEGTNNQTELEDDIYEHRWCVQQGFQHVFLEVDSELLSKWISHRIKPS